MSILQDLPLLNLTAEVEELVAKIVGPGMIPREYPEDASHIAVATVNGLDYLLTWNLSHIANAMLRNNFERLIRSEGYEVPIICTPEELMEGDS